MIALAPTLEPRDATTGSAADTVDIIAQHRAGTEQALARIRNDASLTDRERIPQITRLLAEANGRMLALYALRRRSRMRGAARTYDQGCAS